MNNEVIQWEKQDIKWETIPNGNHVLSRDCENEVFLALTDKSYTDGKYLYKTCSIDHRTADLSYVVSWHEKLRIYTFIEAVWKDIPHLFDANRHVQYYVHVRGRRVFVDGFEMVKKMLLGGAIQHEY